MPEFVMKYSWILWDLATVSVITWLVYNSAFRGLMRTVVNLAGFALAAFVANLLSPLIAGWLYDNLLRDVLRLVIMTKLEGSLAEGGAAASQLSDAIPATLRRLMNPDALNSVGETLAAEAGQIVTDLIDAALREPLLSIIGGILFLLFFSLILVFVRKFARLFTGIYKIPVIGTVNTIMGGILGVLEAGLLLVVAALVIRLIIGFSGGWPWMDEAVMDNTYIWRVFYNAIKL